MSLDFGATFRDRSLASQPRLHRSWLSRRPRARRLGRAAALLAGGAAFMRWRKRAKVS
jgi:hypothetical protein